MDGQIENDIAFFVHVGPSEDLLGIPSIQPVEVDALLLSQVCEEYQALAPAVLADLWSGDDRRLIDLGSDRSVIVVAGHDLDITEPGRNFDQRQNGFHIRRNTVDRWSPGRLNLLRRLCRTRSWLELRLCLSER